MRKLLFVCSITMIGILAYGICHAQDTVEVKHDAYTSFFAKSAHIPALVVYTLRKQQIDCQNKIPRTNRFKPDPDVPGTSLSKDYSHSGYDKGHNMSAEDNACDAGDMEECFYYTNMFPQAPGLNRGIWKQLENTERDDAISNDSIIVFIGSFGSDTAIGPDQVSVPAFCWKVIYIPQSKQWHSYIFPNESCPGIPDDFMQPTKQQRQWITHCIRHFTHYKY